MKTIATDDEIVAFIVDRTRKDKYPPTIRDIMEFFGYESTSSVKSRLDELRRIGRITSEPGKPRTLRVIKR